MKHRRRTPASHPTACSMRSTASASAATDACLHSTAMKIASTRYGATKTFPWSRSSIGRRAGATRRSSRSMHSSTSWRKREIPAVAPLALNGATLHHFEGFRFAVYPRRGGRAPELDDAATLERLGRFIGRIHAVGASPLFARPRDVVRGAVRRRIARLPPERRLAAGRPRRGLSQRDRTGAGRRAALLRARRASRFRCGCMATATAATCCGPIAARISSISTMPHGAGRAGPVDAAVGRARRDGTPAAIVLERLSRISATSTAASCISSRRCARCG